MLHPSTSPDATKLFCRAASGGVNWALIQRSNTKPFGRMDIQAANKGEHHRVRLLPLAVNAVRSRRVLTTGTVVGVA